jgi:hypothetical protein
MRYSPLNLNHRGSSGLTRSDKRVLGLAVWRAGAGAEAGGTSADACWAGKFEAENTNRHI